MAVVLAAQPTGITNSICPRFVDTAAVYAGRTRRLRRLAVGEERTVFQIHYGRLNGTRAVELQCVMQPLWLAALSSPTPSVLALHSLHQCRSWPACHPILCGCPNKIASQTKGGIGGHGASLADEIVDSRRANSQILGQTVCRQAKREHEVLLEHLSRMYGIRRDHRSFLVRHNQFSLSS